MPPGADARVAVEETVPVAELVIRVVGRVDVASLPVLLAVV